MIAHCLYVLTDDNYPTISDIRADVNYLTCLLDIVRPNELPNGKGKEPSDQQSVMLGVLVAGEFAVWLSCRYNYVLLIGILRNISPLPPLSLASSIDIDKDIVLPLLQPVITSIDLLDVTNSTLQLVAQEVAFAVADDSHRLLMPVFLLEF